MRKIFVFMFLLLFPYLSTGDTIFFEPSDGVCWILEVKNQERVRYGKETLTPYEGDVLLKCIAEKLKDDAQKQTWTIRIFDKLDTGKVNEEVSITLGDQTKSFTINQATPYVYTQFDCPNGSWPYSVETFTSVAKEGSSYSVRGRTKGVIDCNANVDFDLIGDYSLYGVLLTLQNKAPVPQLNTQQPSAGFRYDNNKAVDNSACRQVPNPRFGFGNGSAIRIDSGGYSISTSTEPRYILKCPDK